MSLRAIAGRVNRLFDMSIPRDGSSKQLLKPEVDAVEMPGVPGDLLLVCSDGVGLRVHSQILQLASSTLRTTTSKTLKVEGASSAWKLAMEQLYPLHPRPPLTFSTVQSMLRIVHVYEMTVLRAGIAEFVNQHFPAELSSDPSAPGYIMTWLALADELQMPELRHMCMCKLRSLAFAGTLEDTLLQRVVPSVSAAPATAPASTGAEDAGSTSPSPDAAAAASPASGANALPSAGGEEASAITSSEDASASSASTSSEEAWLQDDRPELHPTLRQLSRSTIEELLASLAMVASKRYADRTRVAQSRDTA